MSILIIDVGSSSVRALLFGYESALISEAIARRGYRFNADATTDAHHLRQLVESCIDEVLMMPSIPKIRAVGMATFVGNLMGVDTYNYPTTPLYTYADNRSRESAKILTNDYDGQAVHARTGCRIHTAYHPAKLHWLKKNALQLVEQTAYWVDFATYCYSEWFGYTVPCSYSIASWSGLLNRETLTWDAIWLTQLGLNEAHLPLLTDYNDTQQGLYAPYADRWSQLRDTPFYLAIGDGAGANIGSGGISPDRPVLTVGTTSALRIITTQPTPPPEGLWSYRVDKNHHLIGGSTNEGGNIFAWAKETLQLPLDTIEEALISSEPASHGLTVLPLLGGERSPNYNESATGTLHGITLNTTLLNILHALLESVALRLRLILESFDNKGDFILAGGGALHQSHAWAQIFADILERPIYLLSEREVTARGVYDLIKNQPLEQIQSAEILYDKQFFPRLHYAPRYADLLDQQKQLYTRLYHKG
ncbi:MAG: gluconokinase [bacterium]|nr:gluconokinase [bacterium]